MSKGGLTKTPTIIAPQIIFVDPLSRIEARQMERGLQNFIHITILAFDALRSLTYVSMQKN